MHLTVTLVMAFFLLLPGGGRAADSSDDLGRQRRELAHRQRRIILNNDGCDGLYFPKNQEPTAEDFLALRTSPLADSQVDAVFYCTISAGFGNFTHRTQVGHRLVRQVAEELDIPGKRNLTQTLIDRGTDPLQLVTDWCHAHGKECFWSMRMNDTHDAAHRPAKPYPLFPPLKVEHPEWLVGALDRVPRHGPWSSVDYGREEVRELAFRFVEEVCQNYDVDGVELDFCRHLCYFPSVAFGGQASADECQQITELMTRIRRMTEAEGRRRGRPILVAIRVPDCAQYSRAVGLDWEAWLSANLVDLLIGGFYFQLNPWESLVAAGQRHGVAVYAGLSESRVRGDAPPFSRNSAESYRGRAMRAWQAGVDGIYLFNYFNPQGSFLREIGEPESLRKLDKIYYATIRNRDPNSYLAEGRRFLNVPVLTPQNGLAVPVGQTQTIALRVGDDLATSGSEAVSATLHLQTSGAAGFGVRLNGTPLDNPASSGVWTQYPVPPSVLRPGSNQVALTALASQTPQAADAWNVIYQGPELPAAPWSSDRRKENLECVVENGALRIADRGTAAGDYFYWTYPWNAAPDREAVVEARVQVVSGWNNLIVCNGQAYERVSLYPDRIALYEAKLESRMDTTDGFHTYRVVLQGNDIRVFVDDDLRLDGRGTFTSPLPGRNDVRFGAANSPSQGEAYWQSVKMRYAAGQAVLSDLVLSVRHGTPAATAHGSLHPPGSALD
jgi:hypothetical protein